MNNTITYGELCLLITETPTTPVPKYKQLAATDTPMIVSPDGSVLCYKSGYVTYIPTTGNPTVFTVFDCKTLTYESKDNITLTEEQTAQMPWYIPMVTYGETQAAKNRDHTELRYRHFMIENEKIEDFGGVAEDEHSIEPYLDCLTEYQQKIIILRIVEGYTFAEIADALDVSKGTVQKIVERALKKIAEFMQI